MPFLIFGLVSIIPAISLLSYPIDATGKELDDNEVLYQIFPDNPPPPEIEKNLNDK
jgi:hypothetical protein